MIRRSFGLALFVLMSLDCGGGANATAPRSGPPVQATSTCVPTDQDQYVYRPARLQLLMPCARAFGTIVASSTEADGDVHLDVRLDPISEGLLNAGNRQEGGYLVVEPVCRIPPLQAEAIRVCASDPDPYEDPLPQIGDHIWLEGRYVLDLQHHAWAELHPLYRWGHLGP